MHLTARFLRGLLGLTLLCSTVAHAQRVVVLEFRNDKAGKLRLQVERALRKSATVEVLDLRKYKAAAAKKKLKGARAATPAAVAQLAKVLGLNSAVGGSVGKSLRVQIWNASGAEVWKKQLPLKRGLLSAQDARRLASAVAIAVGGTPVEEAPAPATPKVEVPAPATPKVEAPSPTPPVTPEPKEEPTSKLPPVASQETKSQTADEREKRMRDEMAESHTTSDSGQQPATAAVEVEAKGPSIGPKLITAQLTGTTTWRSYCSRPGFSSCSQYNAVDPSQRPPGDTVDFKAEVPYVGFSLGAEVFPFAQSRSLVQGIGLLLAYERGFSLTNVKIQTSSGPAPDRQVYAADQALSALGAYRYFFALGQQTPLTGYVGIRAGFATRRFDVDSNAPAPLPGSHRNYPVIGIDGSVPLLKFLRFEGAVNYFVSPKPSSAELSDYGASVSTRGWGLEVGPAGDVWGPLGYVLRFRYSRYKDQFSGSGAKWQGGGAAEESYVGVYWGALAHF